MEVEDNQDTESDLDMAFNLQMQEAMAASLALQPPNNLHPRIDLTASPENYSYQRPFCTNDASSSSMAAEESECLSLYCKGLVSEERVMDVDVNVAGAGVAICDSRDNLVFEVKKNLEVFGCGGEVLSNEAAELEALFEGLNTALTLELRNLRFYCDNNKLYQYVTSTVRPEDFQITSLVAKVALLQRKFEHCTPSLVEPRDIKFAYQFAREAIASQINWPASNGKRLNETCVICFEERDVAGMFSVDDCLHRYCYSCMKQHVEAKLLNRSVVQCPHEGCKSELSIDSCETFLEPKFVQVMQQQIKEVSIPDTEKVYCPNPKCSALMSKTEVLEYTRTYFVFVEEESGVRKCMECHSCFCINCKVPFDNHTCYENKKSNPCAEEQLVKSLAKEKHWRQCDKCSHMIELAEGCYHITCRCGYEFCYTCGAEWKGKNPTCSCPIWDEHNIIRQ